MAGRLAALYGMTDGALVNSLSSRPLAARAAVGLAAAMMLAATACQRAPVPAPPIELAHEVWAGFFALDVATLDTSRLPVLSPPVRIIARDDSEALFADFAGGRYDGIAASLVDLLRLQQVVGGLRLIACTDESIGADEIVARTDVRDIAALRGKRIGVTLGGFGEMLVSHMLGTVGLTVDDVRISKVDANRAPAMLRSDSVDAIHTWEPYARDVRGPDFRVLYSTREAPGLVIQCLVVRDRVLRDHPDAVRALLQRTLAIAPQLNERPDSVRALAAQALGREVASLPSVTGVRWLTVDDNRRLLGVGQAAALPLLAAEHVRFLAGIGTLRTPPNVPAFIAHDFLPP